MFAYPDAARHRIGVNYQQLPTNAPHAPVYSPFQRDGLMNLSSNYGEDPSYVNSSLQRTRFAPKTTSPITEHEKWVGEVCSFVTTSDEKDYEQATGLWKVIGREPGHQDRFVENVAGSVRKVKSKELREDVYGMFFFFSLSFPGSYAATRANLFDSTLWPCELGAWRAPKGFHGG